MGVAIVGTVLWQQQDTPTCVGVARDVDGHIMLRHRHLDHSVQRGNPPAGKPKGCYAGAYLHRNHSSTLFNFWLVSLLYDYACITRINPGYEYG